VEFKKPHLPTVREQGPQVLHRPAVFSMITRPRSAFEGIFDENLSATLNWLQKKELTRVGTDFRFSLDAELSQPALFDPVLSWPLQRAKRRARDEIEAIRETWKPKSGHGAAPTLTDDQWAALKDKRGSFFLDLKRLPSDAIAFYRPFHVEPFEAWGIYVLVDRLLRYGQGVRLQLPIFGELSDSVFLHLVLFEMFHHEFFHHLVESAATTIEILASALGAPIPSYLGYRDKAWARAFTWHRHQPLEEALANAYAYNSLGFISRVKTGYKDYLVGLYQSALKRHWLLEPKGYREAEHYISGAQVAGCTDLLAMILGRTERAYYDDLVRIARSVMPSGFTAYVSKPDIPTYFVGQPELVKQFYDRVPSPNETYCNLFWPLNTEAADKLVRERKAKDDEERRRRALLKVRR
jgi:hypothetical protein